jgi:histidinol-phosphate aminotransferase
MTDFEQYIPQHIRELAAYTPGKPIRQAQSESGTDSIIKLASNENPFGPSPKALAAIAQAAGSGNFYPDNDNLELRRKLAKLHDLSLDEILVTAGTTQFIDILSRTLLAPGLNAVSSEKTFIVYAIAVRAAGGEYHQVTMRDHAFDLDALLRAIDERTRLVFLANPNNPTGTMFDAAATDKFLARVPDHVLVVLDEAYCDFAQSFAKKRSVDYSHSLDYIRQGKNIIVLRTFSKAHGLAGIRVGYGFGPQKLLQHFSRVRTAFAVSCVAEAAAVAALDDHRHVAQAVESNLRESVWLEQSLRELGCDPVPTNASFIYFECGEDAGELARRIQAQGIIVRPLGVWGSPQAIRVTVGTPEQNRRFIAALKAVREKAAVR